MAGPGPSPIMAKILLTLIALYLFLWGFVFAVCVGMSNADLSPEVSLDFGGHPIRSILLIVLVVIPFLLMVTVGRGTKWAWTGLRLFAGALAIFGIYSVLTPHGWFQALTGTGTIRHGSSIVYAASSIAILGITVIPGLRRRFADGL